jgi:hypothetical protein
VQRGEDGFARGGHGQHGSGFNKWFGHTRQTP